MEVPVQKVLFISSYSQIVDEYQYEMNRLKSENVDLRNARESAEKNYHLVMNDNNSL